MRAERRRALGALGALLGDLAPGTQGARGLAVLASGLAATANAATLAGAFDLAQLMQALGGMRAGQASFVERRHVALLDRVQISQGRLSFEAPDTFVRETLAPRRERLAVQGNTLTMSMGDRSRTLQLDASPEAAVLIEALRGTLTGNRDALERLFETSVTGTAARWSLQLLPRDARMRGQVAQVTVRGESATVREIDVLLADGDRSVMAVQPLTAAVPDASPAHPPARTASQPAAPLNPVPAARPAAPPTPLPPASRASAGARASSPSGSLAP